MGGRNSDCTNLVKDRRRYNEEKARNILLKLEKSILKPLSSCQQRPWRNSSIIERSQFICHEFEGDFLYSKNEKPPDGAMKINFDGSVTGELLGASGFVIRDSRGRFLQMGYQRTNSGSVIYNEVFAALLGVRAALGLCPNAVLEGDNLLVIHCLQGLSEPPWLIRHLINEILDLSKLFRSCTYQHIFREGNMTTDFVSKGLVDSTLLIQVCARIQDASFVCQLAEHRVWLRELSRSTVGLEDFVRIIWRDDLGLPP